MALLVKKFGGTSVGDIKKIKILQVASVKVKKQEMKLS